MKCIRAAIGGLIFLAATSVAWADADVGPYYWVLKKLDYIQTSTSDPVPYYSVPAQINSVVTRNPAGGLTSGTITPPSGGAGSVSQNYNSLSDGSLAFDGYFPSQGNMDGAFVSGDYVINLKGKSRDISATLTLTGNNYPVTTPKFSNTTFNNGDLVVNRTTAVSLNWNSAVSDLVLLTIMQGDTVVARQVMPGGTVQATFPANYFAAEKRYLIELSFVKKSDTDTNDISGSTGFAGYARSTRINLNTSVRTPVNGLANISTRGPVGVGQKVLIAGFIVISPSHGTSPVRVVLRALGPTLADSSIQGYLANPTLTVYDSSGKVIIGNDDWANSPRAQEIKDAGLAPDHSSESAVMLDLAPGPYTAAVAGANNTTGIGLVEAYNLSSPGDTYPTNISTRGQVGIDDSVMIGGFIIQGSYQHSVIVRALGPSLAKSGISDVLMDPVLKLYNAQGAVIETNDNWKDTNQSGIEATKIPPTDDRESAIVRLLSPGQYTAVVKGKDQTVGVGLVEVYRLD